MVTAEACVVTARHRFTVWACPARVPAVRFFEGCAVFPVALFHRWAVFRRGCPPFTRRGLLAGRRLSPTVPTLAPSSVTLGGRASGHSLRSRSVCVSLPPRGHRLVAHLVGLGLALSPCARVQFSRCAPPSLSPSEGISLGVSPSGRSVVPDRTFSIANSSFYDIFLSYYDKFLL